MAIDWSPLVQQSAARNDAVQTGAYNLGDTLGRHGKSMVQDIAGIPGGLLKLLFPKGGEAYRDNEGFFQGGSSYDPETGEGGKLFGRAREGISGAADYMSPENIKARMLDDKGFFQGGRQKGVPYANPEGRLFGRFRDTLDDVSDYMSPESIKGRMTDQEGLFQGGFDSGKPRDRMFGRLRDAGEGIYGIGKNVVGGIAGMPGEFTKGLKSGWEGEDGVSEEDYLMQASNINTNLDPDQTTMENTNLDPDQTSMQGTKQKKGLLDYLFPNQGQFYKDRIDDLKNFVPFGGFGPVGEDFTVGGPTEIPEEYGWQSLLNQNMDFLNQPTPEGLTGSQRKAWYDQAGWEYDDTIDGNLKFESGQYNPDEVIYDESLYNTGTGNIKNPTESQLSNFQQKYPDAIMLNQGPDTYEIDLRDGNGPQIFNFGEGPLYEGN